MEGEITGETMSETEIPTLSVEQKNEILILQRQMMALQLEIHNAQQQFGLLTPKLTELVQRIASELNIDVDKYAFDLDHLAIVPKPV